jgi:hypothetical protein
MANDKEVNMWELGSGLPLDGARVHATEAIFTYNQEYSADAVVLDITWQPWDGAEDEGEAKHQLYSVGKRWEPVNEGTEVAHESGKLQMFNNQTNIGKLIHSLLEALGDGDVAEGMKQVMAAGLEPYKVDCWIGMDVTLKAITYTTQNNKESSTFGIGEVHSLPGGEAAAPAKTPAKKAAAPAGKAAPKPGAAAAAKPAAKAEASGEGEEAWIEHLGQGLYRKLKAAAEEAADHDAFMDTAFAMDAVTSDDKAWNKATERIIMAYEADSLFGTARADA